MELRLELAKLPNMARVGGNARHTSSFGRADAYRKERDDWIALLRPYETTQEARITGDARLHIVAFYPTESNPDYENALYAYKTLIDLTQVPKVTFIEQKGGKRVPHQSGWLGWVVDDKQYVWPYILEKVNASKEAPKTIVEVTSA